jgi:hypothetical protein
MPAGILGSVAVMDKRLNKKATLKSSRPIALVFEEATFECNKFKTVMYVSNFQKQTRSDCVCI